MKKTKSTKSKSDEIREGYGFTVPPTVDEQLGLLALMRGRSKPKAKTLF